MNGALGLGRQMPNQLYQANYVAKVLKTFAQKVESESERSLRLIIPSQMDV